MISAWKLSVTIKKNQITRSLSQLLFSNIAVTVRLLLTNIKFLFSSENVMLKNCHIQHFVVYCLSNDAIPAQSNPPVLISNCVGTLDQSERDTIRHAYDYPIRLQWLWTLTWPVRVFIEVLNRCRYVQF